jgi:hypothetical protein
MDIEVLELHHLFKVNHQLRIRSWISQMGKSSWDNLGETGCSLFANKTFPNRRSAVHHLHFHRTVANANLHIRQLAKVHWIFANIPT